MDILQALQMPQIGVAGLTEADPTLQAQAEQSAQGVGNIAQANIAPPKLDDVAALGKVMGSVTDAPDLKFGVNAHGIGEGIAQGLSNAVNNFYALKHYHQQQQAHTDLAKLYKDSIDQNQAYATQQATNTYNALPDALKPLYLNSDANGRAAIVGDLAKNAIAHVNAPVAAQDKAAETTTVGEASNQNTLALEKAKQQALDEQFQQLTGVTRADAFRLGNKGQLTPQIRSAFQSVYGKLPEDYLDYRGRYADTVNKIEGAKGAAIDNQTRGPRNEASLQSTLVNTHGQQITNAINAIKARYEEQHQINQNAGESLDVQAKAKKVDDANKVNSLIDGLTQAQANGTLTDQQLFDTTLQLKKLGADINPLESLKTLYSKPKSGDTVSHEVAKANKDNPIRQKNEQWAGQNGFKPLPSGKGYLDKNGMPHPYPGL